MPLDPLAAGPIIALSTRVRPRTGISYSDSVSSPWQQQKKADPKAGPFDCGRNLESQPQSDLQAPRLRAVREPAIALSDSEGRGGQRQNAFRLGIRLRRQARRRPA